MVLSMVSKIPSNEEKTIKKPESSSESDKHDKVKLEVYGEEMVEKVVRLSGNSGRVYLPPDWVGCRVKIIRLD
jgi:putative transposon-encoded protein